MGCFKVTGMGAGGSLWPGWFCTSVAVGLLGVCIRMKCVGIRLSN